MLEGGDWSRKERGKTLIALLQLVGFRAQLVPHGIRAWPKEPTLNSIVKSKGCYSIYREKRRPIDKTVLEAINDL